MSRQRFDCDLAIVGAGFAGLSCARSAALRGLKTIVIERKEWPGARIHTTGLIVKEAAERWEMPARIARPVHGVRLYAPNLRHADLQSPGYYFLATDTAALMGWLADEARRAGASLHFGHRYRGARRVERGIELLDGTIRTRYLVGADGPNSHVARDFALGRNRSFLFGVETEYEGVGGIDPARLHCFVDARLAPGYIGWLVPGVGGIAQVGLAARFPQRPDRDAFERKLQNVFDFSAARRMSRRGGWIPVGGRVRPLGLERVVLAGDAAGIVSPLTAGGIHTALDSGWRAAHAIADHLAGAGPAPDQVLARAYPRFFWKRGLRRLANLSPPDFLLNAALGTAPLRWLAATIFFHSRGGPAIAPESAEIDPELRAPVE
jgi:flavin-dependent dehydrogenase